MKAELFLALLLTGGCERPAEDLAKMTEGLDCHFDFTSADLEGGLHSARVMGHPLDPNQRQVLAVNKRGELFLLATCVVV